VEAKEMQKDIEQNEPYDVSISDWISFLQERTSIRLNTVIFVGSSFIALIFALPLIVIEFMGKNIPSFIFILVIILLTYLFFYVAYKKLDDEVKPFNDLLIKIMQGKIIKPKEILIEYNNINGKKK
jgi:hypothetical protein